LHACAPPAVVWLSTVSVIAQAAGAIAAGSERAVAFRSPPVTYRGVHKMANEFRASTVIDRPISEVFAFLADGTNDPKFSPRVQEIRKTTDGPVGVGTVFESTVKDAGMTTKRKFELTSVDEPTQIRWTERSKNMVTVPDGGYDLEPAGESQTKVTIHNTFEGHGFGKLIVGFALRAAIKDAPALAQRIKDAVEAG
jgi:uncharacterized protein YndB with AHSA1/START domain